MKFFRRLTMKKYERALYNDLIKKVDNEDEPLKNVKNSMGSLSQIVGNPLFKAEISLNIDVFFYDALGAVIIAPAALPLALQTSLPVTLFGLTDFFGAFNKSRLIVPLQNGWILSGIGLAPFGIAPVDIGIAGYNFSFALFPPFLLPVMNNGDLYLFYSDNGLHQFNAIVRVQCNAVSYGTFLHSFSSDLITVNQIRYIVPVANINQFINPLVFGYQTLFGKLSTDSVDPRNYQLPTDFQNQISDIPIKFPIDKNLMLCTNIDIFCQFITMTFFVNKVEPLTHK